MTREEAAAILRRHDAGLLSATDRQRLAEEIGILLLRIALADGGPVSSAAFLDGPGAAGEPVSYLAAREAELERWLKDGSRNRRSGP